MVQPDKSVLHHSIIQYYLLCELIPFIADCYPHFECQAGDHYQPDACCRCIINYHWECNILRQYCGHTSQRCPTEQQVQLPGECCPICLQARQNTVPSGNNYPSANTNQGTQQLDECTQVHSHVTINYVALWIQMHTHTLTHIKPGWQSMNYIM